MTVDTVVVGIPSWVNSSSPFAGHRQRLLVDRDIDRALSWGEELTRQHNKGSESVV